MKIMSRHSWIYLCVQRARGHTIICIRKAKLFSGALSFNLKENRMTWEKPQAVDMRWGFEITMYIANR